MGGTPSHTTRALSRVLGTRHIGLNLFSPTTGTTRHFERADELNAASLNVRIWQGVHFRTADRDGSAIGRQIGDWALDHYFHRL